MGKVHRTSIQSWCTHAVNPIVAVDRETGKRGWACTKVAQGCSNCYAERLNRRLGTGHGFDAKGETAVEWEFDEQAIESVLRMRGAGTVFWCDMTDLFHERVPYEWIDQVFAAMALTSNLRHIVLTKQPTRMRKYFTRRGFPVAIEAAVRTLYRPLEEGRQWRRFFERMMEFHASTESNEYWPLPHVALGVSVATQRDADELVPELLATPATLRFVSYEPAVEAVDWRRLLVSPGGRDGWRSEIDTIIIGGESGPGARAFDLAWARDTIAQCEAAGVVPMLKQLGRRVMGAGEPYGLSRWILQDGGEWVPPIIGERAHARPDNAIGWVSADMHSGDSWAWPADLRPYACSPERWPWEVQG